MTGLPLNGLSLACRAVWSSFLVPCYGPHGGKTSRDRCRLSSCFRGSQMSFLSGTSGSSGLTCPSPGSRCSSFFRWLDAAVCSAPSSSGSTSAHPGYASQCPCPWAGRAAQGTFRCRPRRPSGRTTSSARSGPRGRRRCGVLAKAWQQAQTQRRPRRLIHACSGARGPSRCWRLRWRGWDAGSMTPMLMPTVRRTARLGGSGGPTLPD